MKRWIAGLSATFVMALSGLAIDSSYSQEELGGSFYCGNSVDGTPTTIFKPSHGTDFPIIKWTSTYFSGSGFIPERRCQIVSKRLQQAFQTGNLKYFISTNVNGYPVICASKQMNGNCGTLILTLRENEDPVTVLNQLRGGDVDKPDKGSSVFFACASRSASGNCSGLLLER
jgi:hypothetical protein